MSIIFSICQCVADLFLQQDRKQNVEETQSTVTIVQQPETIPIPTANITSISFKSGEDIPEEYFSKNVTIHGEATFIMDGDTFKFFHKANSSARTPTSNHVLKNATIKIRIAGIDTPEVSHGNKPAQAFGQESSDYLSSLIFQKQISLKLLSRDQYGRVIALVMVGDVDVGLEMIKKGMADLYSHKGAEYGGKKREMEVALRAAKASKVGIWSQSGRIESPADYKRRNQ